LRPRALRKSSQISEERYAAICGVVEHLGDVTRERYEFFIRPTNLPDETMFSGHRSLLNAVWCLAQHSEVPSRFLDLTIDPDIAVKFAHDNGRREEKLAAVYVIPVAVHDVENSLVTVPIWPSDYYRPLLQKGLMMSEGWEDIDDIPKITFAPGETSEFQVYRGARGPINLFPNLEPVEYVKLLGGLPAFPVPYQLPALLELFARFLEQNPEWPGGRLSRERLKDFGLDLTRRIAAPTGHGLFEQVRGQSVPLTESLRLLVSDYCYSPQFPLRTERESLLKAILKQNQWASRFIAHFAVMFERNAWRDTTMVGHDGVALLQYAGMLRRCVLGAFGDDAREFMNRVIAANEKAVA